MEAAGRGRVATQPSEVETLRGAQRVVLFALEMCVGPCSWLSLPFPLCLLSGHANVANGERDQPLGGNARLTLAGCWASCWAGQGWTGCGWAWAQPIFILHTGWRCSDGEVGGWSSLWKRESETDLGALKKGAFRSRERLGTTQVKNSVVTVHRWFLVG